jgi:hypothetical protein
MRMAKRNAEAGVYRVTEDAGLGRLQQHTIAAARNGSVIEIVSCVALVRETGSLSRAPR